uniref:Uncharacterized protein n=1 Tax=Anas platyrhynchos platyrhynchos TaxID=8840 RepID=A0A493T9M8_ANAPP
MRLLPPGSPSTHTHPKPHCTPQNPSIHPKTHSLTPKPIHSPQNPSIHPQNPPIPCGYRQSLAFAPKALHSTQKSSVLPQKPFCSPQKSSPKTSPFTPTSFNTKLTHFTPKPLHIPLMPPIPLNTPDPPHHPQTPPYPQYSQHPLMPPIPLNPPQSPKPLHIPLQPPTP